MNLPAAFRSALRVESLETRLVPSGQSFLAARPLVTAPTRPVDQPVRSEILRIDATNESGILWDPPLGTPAPNTESGPRVVDPLRDWLVNDLRRFGPGPSNVETGPRVPDPLRDWLINDLRRFVMPGNPEPKPPVPGPQEAPGDTEPGSQVDKSEPPARDPAPPMGEADAPVKPPVGDPAPGDKKEKTDPKKEEAAIKEAEAVRLRQMAEETRKAANEEFDKTEAKADELQKKAEAEIHEWWECLIPIWNTHCVIYGSWALGALKAVEQLRTTAAIDLEAGLTEARRLEAAADKLEREARELRGVK